MWSQVVLCVLVGFAYAANNPAWNGNQEYIYKIHGRTLTGLEETSNQYSGILVRAQLRIQPRGDSKIQAVIENPEYSQIHSVLNDGWKTEIPDEEISWKSLPMSSKPFQVQMENGKVTNLKVSRDVNNWEANMIKAIMSLFQLNVKGDGTIASQLNTLPDAKSNSGIFYAMEDTVLGETATLYEIRSIPDYQLLDNEDEAHFYEMKQKNHPDGDVIEVFKHEDFSTNRELPAYNFGFGDYMRGNDPATNKMGKYFIRDSSSRAILTGNLNSHDVLFSESINTILVSPTITTQQKAAVISVMRAELKDIKSQDEKIGEINQPIELGNLVYSYNKPSAKDNQVERINNQGGKSQDSDEDDSREQDRNQRKSHYSNKDSDEDYDEDNNKYSSRPSYDRLNHRHRRSIPKKYGPKYYQNEDDDNDDDYYTQDKPGINEAPESPLLTYTTGYKGMFVKNAVEAVKEAEKIAKKIGSELKDKENDHHKETLERFVNLVSLIRTMDADELKQFANKFDSKSNEGEEAASWVAARDSIANAGTGPALLIVKEWIEKKKIEGNEASQVIADMATSARQPTLEYMKTFFKLVKSDKVSNTWPLNDTALITYTHLVRKVYVDKKISRSEYPENSFGTFRTSEGKKFVRKEVIPYLTQMLHKAVQRAETPKIHAYIRALGNTAEPRILNAFEPYLEGKKQASQFQRLLMVLSLGKLPETDPEVASAVFFRIAQNPAEDPAVRIAAILHLMRSNPSAQMLQTLASNTNVEDNEQVKAVVKHSIEELSELDGDEFMIIREKAKSARPLLTDDEYGFQNGANYLRSYIIDELMTEYKSSSQFIPSEDSYHPKGLRYTLRASLNGLYHKLAHMQAVVSSLDQLFDVAYKHTKSYSEEYKNQKQRAQEIQSNPWSSQNIAKILKMKPDEREQLEGFLYLEIGAPLRMLSFDNHTIGQLPENIRKLEESLNKGQKINNFRLYNYREMALAVPTVMGIPFLYTYDSPMLMKAQGQVKAVAQPQLSQNGKIQTPDNIKAEAEMKITVSGKTQGRVTFIAPFEHQQYIAGFDKHWELNLPKLKTEAEIDLNEQQIEAEFEIEAENKVKVAHYRTTPYTSKSDVTDFEPLSALKSTKPIESDQIQSYKQVFGRKSTGVAFEVEINHERQFIPLNRIVDAIYNNGLVDGLAELWEDGYIQHSMFEITYVPEKSSTRKIKLTTNYDQEYNEHPKSQEPRDWRLDEKADPNKRQEELMDVVSAGINNADVVALDTVIHFEGDKNIQYLLTGASAKSYVDSTARARICYKRTSEDNEVKDYELHLVAESDKPNTNGLDPEYALQNAPKIDSEIKLNFGPSDEEKTKIRAEIKYRRSEERKEYVEDSPMNEQCQQEMQKGNKQLDSCNNVTVEANLLDRIKMKLEYENLDSDLEDAIEMAYEATRMHLLPNLEIRKKQQSQESDEDGEISVEVRIHPDLAFVNISVETEKEETIARNIELNDLLRETLVAHPVFNLYDRLVGRHLYGVESYRDFCTVDQTHVNTFSNRTYEAKLSKQWTVMSIYVPREARDQSEERQPKSLEKQLQHQLENYVVLVRQNAQSDKKEDVKIVVSSPDTDYETVDIELKPSQGGKQKAQVSINGKQIEVSEDESEDIKDGYIQVYAIPNGEVKVAVHNNFYVLYDGSRVRMTALNGKLKDATRGLCGTFNDEDSDDFMTSETCVARQPKKFVKSFEVQGNEGEAVRQQFAGDENDCVEKEMPLYINVITARNAKRSSSSRDDDRRSSPRKQDYDNSDSSESDESDEDDDSGAGKKCLVHKTRYVEEGNKICFTTRPLPACRSECEPRGEQTKSVTVHCIQNNRVAQLWKDQIKNGGSPDFSNKKSHKTVQMSVPERCTA